METSDPIRKSETKKNTSDPIPRVFLFPSSEVYEGFLDGGRNKNKEIHLKLLGPVNFGQTLHEKRKYTLLKHFRHFRSKQKHKSTVDGLSKSMTLKNLPKSQGRWLKFDTKNRVGGYVIPKI